MKPSGEKCIVPCTTAREGQYRSLVQKLSNTLAKPW